VVIASVLTEGGAQVVDLTRHLELTQSTVSKHLACLVDSRVQGRQPYCRLMQAELVELWGSVERVPASAGNACHVYGEREATDEAP
jgi:DNA-binding transcriptional ArsR family regulator